MDELAEVLAHFSASIRDLLWIRLGDTGGFSGATIWRGDFGERPLVCAKQHPPSILPADIIRRHAWLTEATRAGLKFVPIPIRTRRGADCVPHDGRVWEFLDWMPGVADFRTRPTQAKLLTACAAVGQLHAAWKFIDIRSEPSRAVRNRLAIFAEWRAHPPAKSPMLAESTDARARVAIAAHLARVESQLRPWAERSLPCQPCVRDLRRDHFLFTGDKLTGLIDYGAADWDTPATDVARMLGELAGNDAELYGAGLGVFPDIPAELIRALDLAGVVGSSIRWLLRLSKPGFGSPAVEVRLLELIERLETQKCV